MGRAFTALIGLLSFIFIAPILGTIAYAIASIIGAIFTLSFGIIQLVLAIALVWMLSTLFRRYVLREKCDETESIAESLWHYYKKTKTKRQARRERNAS